VLVNLGNARAQVRADEEFPPLDFRLDDDEGEVGLRVHITGHGFNGFDLQFHESGDALD